MLMLTSIAQYDHLFPLSTNWRFMFTTLEVNYHFLVKKGWRATQAHEFHYDTECAVCRKEAVRRNARYIDPFSPIQATN